MFLNYEGNSLQSGIYEIRNRSSNKSYIGSAKEFKARWKGHENSLRNNRHKNKHLQDSFNKCFDQLSYDYFLEFHILELMPNSTKEERLIREEYWIDQYLKNGTCLYNNQLTPTKEPREQSCYSHDPERTKKLKQEIIKKRMETEQGRQQVENFLKKGRELIKTNHPLKGTHISEDTRQKMSRAKLGKLKSNETKKRMSKAQKGKQAFLGKHHSNETKQKISKGNFGNKKWLGKKHSAESIEKMRQNSKKRTITAVKIDNNEMIRFNSITEAANELKIIKKNIYDVLSGKYKQIKGYRFI